VPLTISHERAQTAGACRTFTQCSLNAASSHTHGWSWTMRLAEGWPIGWPRAGQPAQTMPMPQPNVAQLACSHTGPRPFWALVIYPKQCIILFIQWKSCGWTFDTKKDGFFFNNSQFNHCPYAGNFGLTLICNYFNLISLKYYKNFNFRAK